MAYVSKTPQRVEKYLRWPPRAVRTMLPSATGLTAGGSRRAQSRFLRRLLRFAASAEGEQSLHVLARGDRQSFHVHLPADTRMQTRVSTTKTGKEREIDIGPRTVEVPKAHRARQREERMRSSIWADPGPDFPTLSEPIKTLMRGS